MDTQELKGLLTAVRAGDMTAFERLYNELKTPAYTVIGRITRDEGTAEDVLQELFVKLYASPPGDAVANPRAYILQAARNMALDALKKRRVDASLDDVAELSATVRDVELKMDVEAALAALPPEECQIVTLHVNGALKFREIAAVMKMPLGTVLWRYKRAVSRLKNELSGGTL